MGRGPSAHLVRGSVGGWRDNCGWGRHRLSLLSHPRSLVWGDKHQRAARLEGSTWQHFPFIPPKSQHPDTAPCAHDAVHGDVLVEQWLVFLLAGSSSSTLSLAALAGWPSAGSAPSS